MTEKENNIVLLMTATIDPNGMSNLKLHDTEIRKRQYIEAINFYLNNTILKIIFCENSNVNIYNEITNKNKIDRLEYINYRGNDYDKSIGKGYGEAKIILYALNNSKFIKNCKYIIKITGRVKILNINDYIRKVKRKNLNGNDIWIDFFSEWYVVSSVCFILSKEILSSMLLKSGHRIHDINFSFEAMLYSSLIEYKNLKIHPSMYMIEGICGGSNKEYLKIGNLKHKGTNAYILSRINRERENYILMIIEFIKYIIYRIIEKCYKFI